MWYLKSENAFSHWNTIPLHDVGEYTVGRNRDVDIIFKSTLVSRNHGMVVVKPDNHVYIKDTNSANGIYINDKRIISNEYVLLKFNDLVGIGAPSDADVSEKELFRLRCREDENEWNLDDTIKDQERTENNNLCVSNQEQLSDVDIVHNIKTETRAFSSEDVIILSDDDENFPKSQLFDNFVLPSNLKIHHEIEDIKEEIHFYEEEEGVESDDSNEKEEIESIDSDEDCKKWFKKLSQSQCAINANYIFSISDSDSSDEDNQTKDISCNSTCISENLDDVLEEVRTDFPSLKLVDELDEPQHSNSVAAKTKPLKELKIILTPIEKSTKLSGDERSNLCQTLVSSSSRYSKHLRGKNYKKKVPIIEAHSKSKTKNSESVSNELKAIDSKVKRAKKRKIEPELDVPKKVHKRSKAKEKSSEGLSKTERKKIQEERKIRLKEIAERNLEIKIDNKNCKVLTKPKVKVSNSRGLFLLQADAKDNSIDGSAAQNCQNENNYNASSYKVTTKMINFKIPKKSSVGYKEPEKMQTSDITDEMSIDNLSVAKRQEECGQSKVEMAVAHQITVNDVACSTMKTPTKVVKFNLCSQIKYYEIDEGSKLLPSRFLKEAPVPKNPSSLQPNSRWASNRHPNELVRNSFRGANEIISKKITSESEQEALMSILEWVPRWLYEQNSERTSPKVSKHALLPMLATFNTIGDYVNIMLPLHLLEIWSIIYRHWIQMRYTMVFMNLDRIDHEPNFITLVLHGVPDKSNREMYPNVDDLVILELLTNKMAENKFGYVTSVQRSFKREEANCRMELFDMLNSEPDNKLIFKVKIRKTSKLMERNKLIRVRIVSKHLSLNLRYVKSIEGLRHSKLCSSILQPKIDKFVINNVLPDSFKTWDNLNESQTKAVKEASYICSRPEPGIYMIQGPPGTGKSLVIINIVHKLLYRKRLGNTRILLCAPSNGAIDELTLKLLKVRQELPYESRFKMLRIGMEDSINPRVLDISLQTLINREIKKQKDDKIKNSPVLAKELDFKLNRLQIIKNQLNKCRMNGENTFELERSVKKTEQDLEKFKTSVLEISSAERSRIRKTLITKAQLVCTTLTSCGTSEIEELCSGNENGFTCCIIDEATQSRELESLIPLILGISKIVLVGDPAQLSPTCFSMEARHLGYDQSLFERIRISLQHLDGNPIQMLDTQYRMHEEICKFPNKYFYGNKLKTADNVKNRACNFLKPFALFGLDIKNYCQSDYMNILEATFILNIVQLLIQEKFHFTIGIVTPYLKQKQYLQSKLDTLKSLSGNHSVDVNTIDGFQGQERDIIIVSLVRSKSNSFLEDEKRINVSLTRAKLALFVCAHTDFLRSHQLWNDLRHDAKTRRCLSIVQEKYIQDISFIKKLIKLN